MPILRSVTSNPIESGIKAFGDMSTILQQREEAPLRRELLAAEIADRRIRTERGQQEMEQQSKVNAEWSRATGLKQVDDQLKADLGHVNAAQVEKDAAAQEGRDPVYTKEQQDAYFRTATKNPSFDPAKVDVQTAAIQRVRTFMKDNAPVLMKGGVLNKEQAPDTFKDFEEVFGPQINRGTDKHGNDVATGGVKKSIKSVIVDPKDGSLSFVLDVTAPVAEGQIFKHIGDNSPVFTVAPEAKGLTEPGNIDLSKRPVVRNADGSISTVRSMSVEMDGQEVLIPLVSDAGKILTKEQAIAEYQKTGKHLGKFDSSTDADAYADALHNDPMWEKDKQEYSAPGKTETSYQAPLTADRGNDPNAPVIKLPAGILDNWLGAHENFNTTIQQLRARLGPEAFAKKMEEVTRTRAENKAITAAMGKVDTGKPVDEQRKAFVTEFTKLAPDSSVKETTELAKTIIADREKVDFGSEAGKQVSDRVRLATRFGADSPEVKAFDAAVGEKKSEKGLAETLYGPNGATKKVFIEKGKEYVPEKGWSLAPPKADAEGRDEDRRIRRVNQQSAQMERLYKDDFKAIDQSMEKDEEKKLKKSELNDEKDRALEYLQDGMSASEAKQKARKEAGKKKKEPTSGIWREISGQETSSAAKRYLTKEYGYSEQEAENIIVTGIQEFYLEDHPKVWISELIGRDQHRTFKDDLGLVEKSKSRILPPRQSEAASPSSPPQEQGKALKPLTEEVYREIISKTKTRGEAEKMARDMGYDHTKGYSPRKLTLRQPSESPVASTSVELPKPTSETWKEITAQGTTSKAKAFLMKKYGYSAEEAVDVLRTGFKKGYVK